jgi:hypothetical protein
MSGKGSGRRPMTIQHDLFESNWDRIFRRDKIEEHKNMLREVNYDGMWQHSCTVDMSVVWVGKDETCDYCGAWEEDGL